MKNFTVIMPFTGIAVRTIEAETEQEAIEKFLDDSTFPVINPKKDNDVDIEHIEFASKIVEGNLFHGVQNEVEVQEN